MAKLKPPEEFDTYRNGRISLRYGERFRAVGGPYFESRRGAQKVSFQQAGEYTFIKYVEQGWYKYIVGTSRADSSTEHLFVGRRQIRSEPARIVYRPYKIVVPRKAKNAKKTVHGRARSNRQRPEADRPSGDGE
jgi:hypothetical protein